MPYGVPEDPMPFDYHLPGMFDTGPAGPKASYYLHNPFYYHKHSFFQEFLPLAAIYMSCYDIRTLYNLLLNLHFLPNLGSHDRSTLPTHKEILSLDQ